MDNPRPKAPTAAELLRLEGWARLAAIVDNPEGRCADELVRGIEDVDPRGSAWARANCRCAECARATHVQRELRRVGAPRPRTAPAAASGGIDG